MEQGLISKKFIDIEWLQKELIEKEYEGEIDGRSIEVWWKILAKWRLKNEHN